MTGINGTNGQIMQNLLMQGEYPPRQMSSTSMPFAAAQAVQQRQQPINIGK